MILLKNMVHFPQNTWQDPACEYKCNFCSLVSFSASVLDFFIRIVTQSLMYQPCISSSLVRRTSSAYAEWVQTDSSLVDCQFAHIDTFWLQKLEFVMSTMTNINFVFYKGTVHGSWDNLPNFTPIWLTFHDTGQLSLSDQHTKWVIELPSQNLITNHCNWVMWKFGRIMKYI